MVISAGELEISSEQNAAYRLTWLFYQGQIQMRIGIISDTHNDLYAIDQFLTVLESEKIQTIIHCGDMTRSATAEAFEDFEIHHVWGNGDLDTFGLQFAIQGCLPGSTSTLTYSTVLENQRLIALHGHDRKLLRSLIECGSYEYVFYGHTHHQELQRFGKTTIINPGALGGGFRSTHSYVILDLKSGETTFKTTA